MKLSVTGYAVIAAVLVTGGLYAGWSLYGPAPVKPETYAPQARQQDGSLALERKPDAQARPKHVIPKGATVERVVQVNIQPDTPTTAKPDDSPVQCPPVTVDLSIVKMPDDTRRVIASSPNGEVVGGVDIPVVATAPVSAPPKWAAGLSFNPATQTYGVFIDRDLGPFRAGLELNKLSNASEVEMRFKVGVRF